MGRIGRSLEFIRGKRKATADARGYDEPDSGDLAPDPDPKPAANPRARGARSRNDHRRAAGQRLLHIDLPEWQVAIIDREAAALGVSRVGWIRALIANRLRNEPRFTRDAELALFNIHSRMRAMGQDLVMIRRRCDGDAGPEAASVIRQIDRQQTMLRELRAALRDGFKGNLDYWETPS